MAPASSPQRTVAGKTLPPDGRRTKEAPLVGRLVAGRFAVAAVVLLGLLLRLHAARLWNLRHPNGPDRLRYGDEPSYDAAARALLEGAGFVWPDRLPLYPAWLAFWHYLTNFDYAAAVYAQAFVGALVVLLTYLLGRRLVGHLPGLLAALLVALSGTLTRQTMHFTAEVLFTPVLLAVAISLVRAWREPSAGRFVWAGCWVGVANLVRPTLLFFPIFVAIAIVALSRGRRRSIRLAGAYMLAAYLVTTPWTIHNYIRHSAFLPLATSNATLWIGSPEFHRLVHDQGYTYTRIWEEVIYPDDGSAPSPVTIEGERYWSERAMRAIRRDPALYGRLVVERLGTYWVGDPLVDWGNTHPFSYSYLRGHMSRFSAVRLMAERAIPIFALLSVIVLWRRRRELLPLYVLLVYTTLLHAATVARVRMSYPFQPMMLIIVSAAALHVAGRVLDRSDPSEAHTSSAPREPAIQ